VGTQGRRPDCQGVSGNARIQRHAADVVVQDSVAALRPSVGGHTCPPDSRARVRGLRRRRSCSSPPAPGSRRPGARAGLRAAAVSKGDLAPPSPLSAARAYATNAPSGPGARAARRSRRVRQAPVHVKGASPASLVLLAAARALISPAVRRLRGWPRLRKWRGHGTGVFAPPGVGPAARDAVRRPVGRGRGAVARLRPNGASRSTPAASTGSAITGQGRTRRAVHSPV
jgi:hypothetical protein